MFSKHIVSTLSTFIVLALVLTACGGTRSQNTQTPPTRIVSINIPTATPEEVATEVPSLPPEPSATPWPDVRACNTEEGKLNRFGNTLCLAVASRVDGGPEVTVDLPSGGFSVVLSLRRYSSDSKDRWLTYLALSDWPELGEFVVLEHTTEEGGLLKVKVSRVDDSVFTVEVVEKSPGYRPILVPDRLGNQVMGSWEIYHALPEIQVEYKTYTLGIEAGQLVVTEWDGVDIWQNPNPVANPVSVPGVGEEKTITFDAGDPKQTYLLQVVNLGGGVYAYGFLPQPGEETDR